MQPPRGEKNHESSCAFRSPTQYAPPTSPPARAPGNLGTCRRGHAARRRARAGSGNAEQDTQLFFDRTGIIGTLDVNGAVNAQGASFPEPRHERARVRELPPRKPGEEGERGRGPASICANPRTGSLVRGGGRRELSERPHGYRGGSQLAAQAWAHPDIPPAAFECAVQHLGGARPLWMRDGPGHGGRPTRHLGVPPAVADGQSRFPEHDHASTAVRRMRSSTTDRLLPQT